MSRLKPSKEPLGRLDEMNHALVEVVLSTRNVVENIDDKGYSCETGMPTFSFLLQLMAMLDTPLDDQKLDNHQSR